MSVVVDSLITDARGFANAAFNAAVPMINNAQEAITEMTSGVFVNGGVALNPPAPHITEAVPEFGLPEFDPGDAPAGVTGLLNLPDLNVGEMPVSAAVNPGFTEPARPAPLHALNLSPPVIKTDLTFPDLPAELGQINITAPTLTERSVPEAPQMVLPEFTAVAPVDDISAPTDYAEQFAAAYRDIAPQMVAVLESQMSAMLDKVNPQFHTQMAQLEARLSTYLAGGTALSPAIENALYERSKGKVNAEFRRVRDTAYSDAAKRGFTLPDGALFSAVQQARQGGADNNARAAADIAIKQAELEQQNLQFAVTTSSQLRTAVLNAALAYHQQLVGLNGQALDYAKSILNAMVQVYDTLVKAFSVKLEAYKAEAAVYETRLRGVMAVIEIYKAEIDALQTLTRLDLAKVEIYKARLEGLNTLATVYRNQIDAVIGQANVEKMKVELFGAQVQAYGTEAQAKNAEWQGYTAAVGGQEARIRAYGEENRVFATQVDAFRTLVQAKQAQVQSVTEYNRGLVQQYAASVDGYRASVDAKSRVASTQIEYQANKLRSFQAKISAEEAQARLVQEYYKTKAQMSLQEFQLLVTNAIENAKLQTQQTKAIADVSLSGAQIYTGLAQSALSGMNTLVTSSTSS